MSTLGTIVSVGAAVLVIAGGAYIVSKHREAKFSKDYVSFRGECVSLASQYSRDGVLKAIVVIDKEGDIVIPSLYRRFEDNRVTKLKLNVRPLPYALLPEDIKDAFEKGQAIIARL